MLLRVIEHPRVIVLLTQVLDFYRRKKTRWQEVITAGNMPVKPPIVHNIRIEGLG